MKKFQNKSYRRWQSEAIVVEVGLPDDQATCCKRKITGFKLYSHKQIFTIQEKLLKSKLSGIPYSKLALYSVKSL